MRVHRGAVRSAPMPPSSSRAIAALAALTLLGACKCASSDPVPPAPTSVATPPVATAAPAPTASASAPAEPSKDAAACPATVEHPGTEGEIVDSWKAVHARVQEDAIQRFAQPLLDDLKPGASDAEIRKALTGKPDGAARAWSIDLGDSFGGAKVWHVVVKRSDGKLALFLAVAEPLITTCPSYPSVAVETDGMPRVIVDIDQFQRRLEGVEDGDPKQLGCVIRSHERKTIFLDVEVPEVPLVIAVEEEADAGRVETVLKQDEVRVVGAGCDLRVPLRR